MATDQKHSSDSTLNVPEDTRHLGARKKLEDYYSKYEKLKRRVNLLEAEIEDLDECVDKETLVDLIQEIVSSLIIRKYKKRGLLCEPLNRFDSSLSDSSSFEDSETVKCYYSKKKLISSLNKQIDSSLEDHVNELLSHHPIKKFRRKDQAQLLKSHIINTSLEQRSSALLCSKEFFLIEISSNYIKNE
ncbi:4483_t:CDS:2 [Dentiscutata erythropus]|uniref:4483_t:CDS:1 n=1 Tax=Dentiscutata erythropus TaxID=1348616 RepID=A0A9N9IXT0_9GLOM|nr:4483_t:CDS:2 [Dentiscutata erythropus]